MLVIDGTVWGISKQDYEKILVPIIQDIVLNSFLEQSRWDPPAGFDKGLVEPVKMEN